MELEKDWEFFRPSNYRLFYFFTIRLKKEKSLFVLLDRQNQTILTV